MLFTGIGVLFVSKAVVLRNIFKLNRWRKKKENGQSYHWHPLITFSRHRKMQTSSQFWFVETTNRVKRVTWSERKDFIPHLISFLVDFVKDLDFRRITLKCENEPSVKVFRESMSHLMVRNEETIQKSQDFRGMQHQCEDHRWNFEAQLDSTFCSAGDLKRKRIKWIGWNLTCLNALEG